MTNWKVRQRYRCIVPDEGPAVGIELVPGSIVSEDDLATFRERMSGADLAEWINRDAPGTLEPTDDPATAVPTRHIPAYLLHGQARRGTQV